MKIIYTLSTQIVENKTGTQKDIALQSLKHTKYK